jgi:hypothetical protein
MKYLILFENFEEDVLENTSATGGLSVSGGVSGQPVGLAGQTLSTNWASGTGKEGGGYLNVPYNPGGANRMQQKIPVMGLNHGPRTGKKSREKRLDLKALRASFKKRKEDSTTNPSIPGEKKVMSFDDFEKSDINTIKKESINESLILENKITTFFKKYDMEEIKRLLKEKLEIDENSTKQEVAKKLFKFYLKLQLKTLKYELGALLGGFIFYFLSIVLDVAGVKPFVTDGTPTMPHFILWGAGALLGIIKIYKDTIKK